jgi:hypothetical protein
MRAYAYGLLLATAACGLEDGGVITGAPGDDASNIGPDASSDGSSATDSPGNADTAVPCNADPASCTLAGVVAGWTPVALTTASSPTCPAAFGQPQPLVSNPAAGAGACDCAAASPVSPTCDNGTLAFKVNAGAFTTCGLSGLAVAVAGGTCTPISGYLADYVSVDAPPATGGSCTGTKTIDSSKLTTSGSLACSPISCPESVCAGVVPPGFAACIEATGDVACPSGPFSTKQLVGDSATLDCSACSCAATATCSGGSVAMWSDSACGASKVFTLPAGSCTQTNMGGTPVKGIVYTATATPTYTATGPKTATVGLVNQKTVCCR